METCDCLYKWLENHSDAITMHPMQTSIVTNILQVSAAYKFSRTLFEGIFRALGFVVAILTFLMHNIYKVVRLPERVFLLIYLSVTMTIKGLSTCKFTQSAHHVKTTSYGRCNGIKTLKHCRNNVFCTS